MLAFLKNNQDLFKKLASCDRRIFFLGGNLEELKPYGPRTEKELSYHPKNKTLIGFYGTTLPQFIWAMTSWISTHNEGTAKIYYDNEVIKTTSDPDSLDLLINDNGVLLKRKKETFIENLFFKFDYNKQILILEELTNRFKLFNENLNTKTITQKTKTKAKKL